MERRQTPGVASVTMEIAAVERTKKKPVPSYAGRALVVLRGRHVRAAADMRCRCLRVILPLPQGYFTQLLADDVLQS